MNITELENGNLLLQVGNTERAEIKDNLLSERNYSSIWYELFEYHSCNGGYTPFNAEDIEGNLSSAPCVSPEPLEFEDEEHRENPIQPDKFWYYDSYMIDSELEELKNAGRLILTQFNNALLNTKNI